jgi:hypothetical protein
MSWLSDLFRRKKKGTPPVVTPISPPSSKIRVSLVNHPGSGVDDAALVTIAAALDRQIKEHFGPLFNIYCDVVATNSPLPTDWVIGMFKDADQPGALGYHDLTPNGLPLAKVFPLLDAQDGANLSTTISHELMEMLADPYLRLAAQDNTGKFWAYEVCDAVEADEYDIDGVKVSNFVTPEYFEPPTDLNGVKLDYLGKITKPFEVRPGGYMQWYDGTSGWNQVQASRSPRAYRMKVSGRAARRARVRAKA